VRPPIARIWDTRRRGSGAAGWPYLRLYCRGKAGPVALVTAIGCIQSLAALPMLYGMRLAFNQVIPARRLDWLVLLGLALVGARLAFGGLTLLGRRLAVKLTKGIVRDIRRDLLAAIYRLPADHSSVHDPARVQTRIVADTERLDVFLSLVVSNILPAALAALMLGLTLFYLNAWLALSLAVLAPCVWGGTLLSGRRVRHAVRAFRAEFEQFSHGVHFVLRHIDLTRTRGFEATELARQTDRVAALERSGVAMAMHSAAHNQLQSNLVGLGVCILLIGGGAAVIWHVMTLGDLLAFYLAAGLMNGYVSTITAAIPDVIAGEQSLTTLAGLHKDAAQGSAAAAGYGGNGPVPADGALTLSGVTFGFGREPLLTDVSVSFRPSEVVAIFGPNGAGKSTLISLILGFQHPWSGSLSIGEARFQNIDLDALRRSFGVVPQRPTFFSGTIAENIGYGRPDAGLAELEEALELAGAAGFVAAMPNGIGSVIGEGGLLVSGGEAQKLAIARALVGRPKFLILDEPTNHLDVDAIAGIMCRLKSLPGHPTVLIISHDPQAAQVCDRVFRLEDGRLTLQSGVARRNQTRERAAA
jgi:ATP-binding cassette subfamily B protein